MSGFNQIWRNNAINLQKKVLKKRKKSKRLGKSKYAELFT